MKYTELYQQIEGRLNELNWQWAESPIQILYTHTSGLFVLMGEEKINGDDIEDPAIVGLINAVALSSLRDAFDVSSCDIVGNAVAIAQARSSNVAKRLVKCNDQQEVEALRESVFAENKIDYIKQGGLP